jgi:uncharacterized membrane protein
MILLALGVMAMAALHLIAAVPAWKERVKARTGERRYGPLFGLASLALLAVIVAGWRLSAFVPVYDPPAWGRIANFLLTFAGFLSFGVFLFRGSLRQRLRFPMGLAVILWAAGHLLANGDEASLILFGGLLIYAAAHIGIGLAQGVRPSPEVRQGHDPLSLLAGAALYAVMTQLHPVVIGVPVLVLGQ